MQSAARAAKVTLAYLRSVDPQRADVADKTGVARQSVDRIVLQEHDQTTMAAAAESIKAVLASLDANRHD